MFNENKLNCASSFSYDLNLEELGYSIEEIRELFIEIAERYNDIITSKLKNAAYCTEVEDDAFYIYKLHPDVDILVPFHPRDEQGTTIYSSIPMTDQSIEHNKVLKYGFPANGVSRYERRHGKKKQNKTWVNYE